MTAPHHGPVSVPPTPPTNGYPEKNYPVGWFQVAWSAELEPGQVRPLQALGHELVAYRSASGDVRVADAYCPHMGAHLGYGGTVCEDRIICPFHAWEWSPTGEAHTIPYSASVNKSARLRQWHVREVSGLVFIWHHPHNEPPWWDDPMPVILENENPDYYPIYPHTCRSELINGHPQMVADNTVDVAHFVYVHRSTRAPELATYDADGFTFRSTADLLIPTKRGEVPQQSTVELYGLGVIIARHQLTLRTKDGGTEKFNEVTIQCMTPRKGGRSELRMTAYMPRTPGDDGDVPTGLSATTLAAGHREVFDHDLLIWDHMQYNPRPAMAREEARPFKAMRDWSAQFYV